MKVEPNGPWRWRDGLAICLAVVLGLVVFSIYLVILAASVLGGMLAGWSVTGGPIGAALGAGLCAFVITALFMRFGVGDRPLEAGCAGLIMSILVALCIGYVFRRFEENRRQGDHR
jgi:hypothetical protein